MPRKKSKTISKTKKVSKSKEKFKLQSRYSLLTTKSRMLPMKEGKPRKYYLAELSTGTMNRKGDAISYQEYLADRGYQTRRIEENGEWRVYARPKYPNLSYVKIKRAEGTREQTKFEYTYDNFDEANKKLRQMAQSAPSYGMGYHKVDFTVKFKDGSQYTGVYDLSQRDMYDTDNIDSLMIKRLKFTIGRNRPRDLNDAQWEQFKKIFHTKEKQDRARKLILNLDTDPEGY